MLHVNAFGGQNIMKCNSDVIHVNMIFLIVHLKMNNIKIIVYFIKIIIINSKKT